MSKAHFLARLVLAAAITGLGAVAHAGTVTVTQNGSTLANCTFTASSASLSGTGDFTVTCDATGGGGGGGGSGSLTLTAVGALYEGGNAKTITLTRPNGTGAATAEVTISGSGSLGTDFSLAATAPNTVTGSIVTLQFADGVTTSSFTLTPRSRDGATQASKSLTVGITNAGSYTAGTTQAGTIADSTLNLTPASQTLIAGGATGLVTVTRTPGVGASTVTLTASGGAPGTDYTFSGANVAASGGTVTLSFADGTAAIPVTVTPVTAASALSVSLTPTNADNYTPGSPASITINPQGSASCVKTGGTAWTNFSRPGLSTAGGLAGGATQSKVTYSFTIPSTMPKGTLIYFNNSSYAAYSPRDHFISECVGDFVTPPAGNNAENCKAFNSMTGGITLGRTDNAASMNSSTCNLEYGKTYYLNIRTIQAGGVYQSTGYLLDTEKRY